MASDETGADQLQISKEQAQEFIDETIERAREEGHVATPFGRNRRVPELRSRQFQTRLVLQIHDELLFEGPAGEVERASEIVARRRA